MEIAQLPPEDATMFMSEYGITELSLNRMISVSYDLLDQQSFFTVGEDEVRAWTTRRHATAVEAAGEIHTDLAHGFVRAEVVAYQDLIDLGGMTEAKAKGQTAPGRQGIYRQGWRYRAYPFEPVIAIKSQASMGRVQQIKKRILRKQNALQCFSGCTYYVYSLRFVLPCFLFYC